MIFLASVTRRDRPCCLILAGLGKDVPCTKYLGSLAQCETASLFRES